MWQDLLAMWWPPLAKDSYNIHFACDRASHPYKVISRIHKCLHYIQWVVYFFTSSVLFMCEILPQHGWMHSMYVRMYALLLLPLHWMSNRNGNTHKKSGLLCLVPYDNSDRCLARMWTALFHSANQESVESLLPSGVYCSSEWFI